MFFGVAVATGLIMVQSQAIIENGLEWTGAFKTRFGVSVGYRLGIVFGIGLTKKIPRLFCTPSQVYGNRCLRHFI